MARNSRYQASLPTLGRPTPPRKQKRAKWSNPTVVFDWGADSSPTDETEVATQEAPAGSDTSAPSSPQTPAEGTAPIAAARSRAALDALRGFIRSTSGLSDAIGSAARVQRELLGAHLHAPLFEIPYFSALRSPRQSGTGRLTAADFSREETRIVASSPLALDLQLRMEEEARAAPPPPVTFPPTRQRFGEPVRAMGDSFFSAFVDSPGTHLTEEEVGRLRALFGGEGFPSLATAEAVDKARRDYLSVVERQIAYPARRVARTVAGHPCSVFKSRNGTQIKALAAHDSPLQSDNQESQGESNA